MRPFPVGAAIAIGVGLVLSPMIVGIPILAYGVGEILGWAHGVEPTQATTSRRLGAGWAATLLLAAAVVCGGVIGVSLIEGIEAAVGDDDEAIAIVVVIAPVLSGLLFAPLALLPSLALAPAPRPPLIVGAVWLAAHRGAAATARLGATLGALGALPFVLAVVVAVIDDDFVPLGLLGGIGLDVVLAGLALRMVARASDAARQAAEDPARHPAALSSLGRLALIPLAALGAVIVLAVSTPLTLVEGASLAPGEGYTVPEGERFPVPGTRVEVRPHWRLFEVRVDGEQTLYRLGGYWLSDRIAVRRGTWRGRAVNEIALGSEYSPTRVLRIDDAGRRVDDGLVDRVASRASLTVPLVLALACVSGVVFWLRVGRVQAHASAIARVVAGGDGGDLVRGELRVRGAPVIAERGTMKGAGSAWIEAEGGALRIALPDAPTEMLAIDPSLLRELPEGTAFVLLTRGARLGGVGMREASAPWPEGALVVVGDPRRAAAARVREIFPSVVGLGIAIGALLVIAALALASSIA